MAFKFKMKMILPLFVAVIFISSVLVVFSTGGSGGSNSAYITVDFNAPNRLYNGKVIITENSTVLDVLASYVPSVEFEQGKVYCIMDYCNTNHSEWKMYKIDSQQIADLEVEIDNVDEFVQAEDKFVFRYELKQTETEESNATSSF